VDGKSIGYVKKSPSKPTHPVLQTETALDGPAPASSAKGNVYVDYFDIWTYTG
jgi:hypothetical protein